MPILNPKIDLVFKKLFGSEENKDILMSLINSILPEDKQIVKLFLKNPYNVFDYADGKLSILDIKAEDENGTRYDIEMQMRGSSFYAKRTLYYWAKMFGTQLDCIDDEDQEDDTTSLTMNYPELKKCIVISLMDFNLFKDERYHRYFMLKDAKTNQTVDHLDYLDLYFIELKKFKGKLQPIQPILDRWITFLNSANLYKDDNLPQELSQVKEIKKANARLATMYFTEKERMYYEGQQKKFLDDLSILQEYKQREEEATKREKEARKKAEEARKKAEEQKAKAEKADKELNQMKIQAKSDKIRVNARKKNVLD